MNRPQVVVVGGTAATPAHTAAIRAALRAAYPGTRFRTRTRAGTTTIWYRAPRTGKARNPCHAAAIAAAASPGTHLTVTAYPPRATSPHVRSTTPMAVAAGCGPALRRALRAAYPGTRFRTRTRAGTTTIRYRTTDVTMLGRVWATLRATGAVAHTPPPGADVRGVVVVRQYQVPPAA